jgi:glucose/arabinose dehydrogenase
VFTVILQYNPDGTAFKIYASGIRNAVGIAFEPQISVLRASVNEYFNRAYRPNGKTTVNG